MSPLDPADPPAAGKAPPRGEAPPPHKPADDGKASGDKPAKEPAKKEEDEGYDDPPMTIWDHLAELRKRLMVAIIALGVCSFVAWEYRETLLAFMVAPFVEAWKTTGIPGDPTLHFQKPAAAFTTYFQLSLLGGAAMASPVLFYELWGFIAPGLYSKEKRFVIPFVVASTALFIGGGYFGWRWAFPLAFAYLLGLGGNLDDLLAFQDVKLTVTPTVMMGEYIDFVTQMLLGFGAIFEIPLVLFFLSMAGVINYLHLIRYGRWFVVIAFVIAAILTPPDVTSQMIMAVPMLLLYGLSILLAFLFGKPPTDAQRASYKRQKEESKKEREVERVRKRAEKDAAKRAAKGA